MDFCGELVDFGGELVDFGGELVDFGGKIIFVYKKSFYFKFINKKIFLLFFFTFFITINNHSLDDI